MIVFIFLFVIFNLINWAIMNVQCIVNKIYSLTIWPEQNYNGLKRHSSDCSNSKIEFNKKKHSIFRIKEEKNGRKFFFLTAQFLFSKHSMIYIFDYHLFPRFPESSASGSCVLGRVLAYGVFGLHAQVYSVLVPSEFAPPYPRVMGRVCSHLFRDLACLVRLPLLRLSWCINEPN